MDDESEDEEATLIMPFITVASNDGPHDDASYVAGFAMGQLDARLNCMLPLLSVPLPMTIHKSNYPQADLIAMRYGFRAVLENDDETDEWWNISFDIYEIGFPG